jgi:hypothetical protein
MGLLRLINAARLAPLEELLAELKSGAPGSVANSGMARGVSPAVASTSFTKPAAPSVVNAVSTQPKPETKAHFSSTFAAQASAPATAGAPTEARQAAEANDSVPAKNNGVPVQAIGISQEHVAEIKAAVQAQQKFLGELVDNSSRWELEGAELRVYFPPQKNWCAEMLEGRESLEKVRNISSKVLGRAVRVCAKLEAVAAAAASASRGVSGTQELRAQFERDPLVRSMLQRFGGKISEVKRSREES